MRGLWGVGVGGWWLLLEASLGGMGMLLNPQSLENPHSRFLPWTALSQPFLERGCLLQLCPQGVGVGPRRRTRM